MLETNDLFSFMISTYLKISLFSSRSWQTI